MNNTEKAGGTRYSEGKPNPMWTPAMGLLEVARVTEYGARKYAPHDWWLGQSYSTLVGSAARHVLAMLSYGPLSRDNESGLLHAAHAAWNLLCLLHFHYEGRNQELDDLSAHVGVKDPKSGADKPVPATMQDFWESLRPTVAESIEKLRKADEENVRRMREMQNCYPTS